MRNIKELDQEYTRLKQFISLAEDYSLRVKKVQTDNESTAGIRKSVEVLNAFLKEVKGGDVETVVDSLKVAENYISCLDYIDYYEKKLYELSGDAQTGSIVVRAKDRLIEAKSHYDKQKDLFVEKYSKSLSGEDDLLRMLRGCLKHEVSKREKSMESVREEAKKLYEDKDSLCLSNKMKWNTTKDLPVKALIAKTPDTKVRYGILKDIGINDGGQEYSIDYRKQGNMIISTPIESVRDTEIDAFIISYIFKAIEKFPMGCLNVHIFDKNPDVLYKRLYNGIQSGDANESTKRIIQLHNNLTDLNTFRDVNCEDILKKTSPPERPDLFSVYETDRTDPFNLIILREGILDGSGYAASEVVDVIENLSNPGKIGHICGLRFLIIDNSGSFDRGVTPNIKLKIGQIKDNCELKMDYSNGGFQVSGNGVEVLHIAGNVDAFVQERTQKVADVSNKQAKSIVSLDDTISGNGFEEAGNIIYIPVGRSGDKVVSLPFSCKDEEGTMSGSCIGYMAIGQTGSGKSSFFHSLIFNGCMKYSPKELQFWLLDFKNGNATSKYRNSGIPHIRIISENNRIDDALCLFQMILEEMERRTSLFNKNFTSNIVEYNAKAEKEGKKTLPRIIIAIDEVQEIFRDDNASAIQTQISSISTRMRSTGMHFVMVSQNLSDGKTYMLKDAFMPSATGRICFRVAPDIPRDSGFGDDFVQRKQEISELKTGEAYVSYGKDTIQKVKMVLITSEEMEEKYFAMVKNRYSSYSDMKPMVIGSKQRLMITSMQQGNKDSYEKTFKEVNSSGGIYRAVIGEDSYRMTPLTIDFSQHDNSTTMLLGSDKLIASSLCTSIALSLIRQGVEVHLFNGDRTKVQGENEPIQHSFMYVCQNVGEDKTNVHNHRMNELRDVMTDLYGEYLTRQHLIQEAEDEDPEFRPIFVVINDLFGIENFTSNDMIEGGEKASEPEKKEEVGFSFVHDIFAQDTSSGKSSHNHFCETIQNAIAQMVKNGWRYNIHLILAIKGDPSTWRSGNIVSEVNNVVIFNRTEYADDFENSYYLKEMLKNIANDSTFETMAVWIRRKVFSKMRPFIYDMSSENEKTVVTRLLKGE